MRSTAQNVRARRYGSWAGALGFALWLGVGCGNDPSEPAPNIAPETFITSGEPRDSSRVPHHVTLNWNGQDVDGTVPRTFDYILFSYARAVATIGQVQVQIPAVDDPRWTRVNAYNITLAVPADTLRADPRGDIGEGEFDRWHTFYLRAVDNEGTPDATPDFRTFMAFTQAPGVWLQPPARGGTTPATLPRTFVAHWDGNDPIGNGPPLQNPAESRWVLLPATLDGLGQPVGYPGVLYDLPDTTWSDWAAWTAPDSSGRNAVVRDRIPAGPGTQSFVFAVQGRDDGGAITPKFRGGFGLQNNYAAIILDGALHTGPGVTVHSLQDTLSAWSFAGIGAPTIQANVTSDTLTLYWDPMRTSHYGGRARDYRYGWNIVDVNDDQEWTAFSTVRLAAPHRLSLGTEVFKLQCRDNIGQVTTATINFHPTQR